MVPSDLSSESKEENILKEREREKKNMKDARKEHTAAISKFVDPHISLQLVLRGL